MKKTSEAQSHEAQSRSEAKLLLSGWLIGIAILLALIIIGGGIFLINQQNSNSD